MSIDVFQTEPIPVHARITCGDGLAVNSASLLLTADDPFRVIPESVYQDPDICNPPVGFKLLPEFSMKGVGWELVKGAGWMLLANFIDDRFHKARY
jgi:hypothetical protein